MKRANIATNFLEGIVVDTNDPQQMGRLKIWIPSLDGDNYKVNNLPWAAYLSPLAGQTMNYPAGPNGDIAPGYTSYGFWAIPKVGALVVVACLYGDPNLRLYVGSLFPEHGNRSLPAGRHRPDIIDGPLTDTYQPLEPAFSNLKAQFADNLTAPEAISRGAVERMVAQDQTEKDGTQGYQKDAVNAKTLDPQTMCITSPGHHSLIFQDNPENGRVRLKSASGHQIILDDANERIYISTSRGNNYIELDADGRVYVFAGGDMAMGVGGDFNLAVAGNYTVSAGGDVTMASKGATYISSCDKMNISGLSTLISADNDIHMLSASTMIFKSGAIHLNGPAATKADCGPSPKTIPIHEPWERPNSKLKRNKNWKR